MRSFDTAFAAHLAGGATTLANCWKLTRADSAVMGFTDHDVSISFAGVTYAPMGGFDAGEAASKLGPQIDTSQVLGVLRSDAIAADDIEAGLYDGAQIEIWRVNWRDTSQRAHLSTATIGEIVREDGMFRAELRSGQQALNQVRGRVYGAFCDALLGDARCKVAHDHPSFGLGCDRQFATCRDRFANVTNFRGFPHIPGADFLLRYPKADSALEGGALFS